MRPFRTSRLGGSHLVVFSKAPTNRISQSFQQKALTRNSSDLTLQRYVSFHFGFHLDGSYPKTKHGNFCTCPCLEADQERWCCGLENPRRYDTARLLTEPKNDNNSPAKSELCWCCCVCLLAKDSNLSSPLDRIDFRRIWIYLPSRQLTYRPQNGMFEDDFPFLKMGYVSSLESILGPWIVVMIFFSTRGSAQRPVKMGRNLFQSHRLAFWYQKMHGMAWTPKAWKYGLYMGVS